MKSMAHKNGHWQYAHQMGSEEYEGFLYLIVNKANKRSYIGRKTYRVLKKKAKTYGKSTNWRVYKSSAKALISDIEELGKEFFDFYCLAEYKDRRDLHYAEVKAIMQYDAIIKEDWYNNHAPEIYVPPPCLAYRNRRETITTLVERSVNNAKEKGRR